MLLPIALLSQSLLSLLIFPKSTVQKTETVVEVAENRQTP